MAHIVAVCTGNICRSPMAEGILRKRLAAAGRSDIMVSSMGIHAEENQPASADAVAVCADHGIDISSHRSRPLIPEDLKRADLVFVMEQVQREFIRVFFPRIYEETFLLGAWPGDSSKRSNIRDPIGAGRQVYVKTFEAIEAHVERIVPLLVERLPQSIGA